MKRATYITKWAHDKNTMVYEYEYRGHTYTVEQNFAKGSLPLSWQHINAQAGIDSSIEIEERIAASKANGYVGEDAMTGFQKFFDYIDGTADEL